MRLGKDPIATAVMSQPLEGTIMIEKFGWYVVGVLTLAIVVVACGGDAFGSGAPNDFDPDGEWQTQFDMDQCDLATVGRNEYFLLDPGFQLVLESSSERLVITVLDETKTVDGVDTRVVEEREWRNGNLIEVSRNFFAICGETDDVFYFGEEVDDYLDGRIVNHGGAWLAGEGDARPGLIMPGDPTIGRRYYQEVAPEVALDRAEILSVSEVFEAPAGTFTNSLRTKEGSALKPQESELKTYAPGIGLIQDQSLLLVDYGFSVSP